MNLTILSVFKPLTCPNVLSAQTVCVSNILAVQPAPQNNVDFLCVSARRLYFYVGFSLYHVVFACMTVQLMISLN